jgi:hypothetical protein
MPRYIVTALLTASLALSMTPARAELPNVVYQNGDWKTYWTRSNKQGHQMCGIQFIGNKADDRHGLYVKHIKVSDDDQYIEVQLTRTAWRIAVGTVIDAALTVGFDNNPPINVKAFPPLRIAFGARKFSRELGEVTAHSGQTVDTMAEQQKFRRATRHPSGGRGSVESSCGSQNGRR